MTRENIFPDGVLGAIPPAANVRTQRTNPDSLLSHYAEQGCLSAIPSEAEAEDVYVAALSTIEEPLGDYITQLSS